MDGFGGSDVGTCKVKLARESRAVTQYLRSQRRGRGGSCGVVQDRITSTLGLSQPSPSWEK